MKFEEADLIVDSVQSLFNGINMQPNPFKVVYVYRMAKDGYISVSGCGYSDTIHFDNKDKIDKWVSDIVEIFKYTLGNRK